MATAPLTPAQFKVDMQQFAHTIGVVRAQEGHIHQHVHWLKGTFAQVGTLWTGPAGQTCESFQTDFGKSVDHLVTLLGEMVHRMQCTYDNYLRIEHANAKNLTPHNHPQLHGASGHHHHGQSRGQSAAPALPQVPQGHRAAPAQPQVVAGRHSEPRVMSGHHPGGHDHDRNHDHDRSHNRDHDRAVREHRAAPEKHVVHGEHQVKHVERREDETK